MGLSGVWSEVVLDSPHCPEHRESKALKLILCSQGPCFIKEMF